ncbi:hypothetical protein BGZ80_005757 [Entomortierella chlamydospora]|uniref:P-loop containing nucleoside triphosphate hydrolase protein n=1 Tax=Entomortierella chlamydospora TaxID=101097 RepID=A0A9P6MZ88_9FUNG|nr:hypothetical protein BGZ80_005757 [Entomortierella chlamydospora]
MVQPAGGLIVFWLFTALISIFPTRSWAQESPNGFHDVEPLLKLIFTIVATAIFVLENIPKANRHELKRPNVEPKIQSNPSPEPSSNLFAKFTFFWLFPLMRLGKKKTLRMDDIWDVHPKLLSYPLYLTTKAKMDADKAIALQSIKDDNDNNMDGDGKKKQFNLVGTVMHTLGYSFMVAVIPRLLYICAYYVRPILFSNLISFVTSYSEASKLQGIEPQDPWIGFGLLKALRLSSTDKQEGMGSIVNHMSTDIDNLISFFQVVHLSWSSLLEIVITFVLLYNQVRYAVFASLAVVIVFVILVGACAPFISKFQKSMMASSDQRMKHITEMVNYMKSIKLYAWESYFFKKIIKARTEQLNQLRNFYIFISLISVLLESIVPFSVFATLSVYSAISSTSNVLDIQRIFTTITLMNMLNDPVSSIQSSLSSIVSCGVAYSRLRDFLNSEEIDEENVIKNTDVTASDIAYEIRDGTFGWYTPGAIQAALEKQEIEAKEKAENDAKDKFTNSETATKVESDENGESTTLDEKSLEGKETNDGKTRNTMGPVLHNISLQIKRGSLTAVVGRVGEGKSSLAGALLGEMHKYSGSVHSYGSLAYVAQSAWILNDTVRNNILFGRPYEHERYLNTIRSCALAPDLRMLVNNDKTIIGEKGINLSGGQKQRISIARAVYADADVYIFDDPLSAVDAHVDHHIFENAIKTILAKKTRLLITNSVKHLHQVDQIVVLKQGRISQDGVYDELIKDEIGDLFRLMKESNVVAFNTGSETEEGNEVALDVSVNITEGEGDIDTKLTDKSEDISVRRPTAGRESSKTNENDIVLDDNNDIDNEIIAEGRVGWRVYKYYLSTLGAFGLTSFAVVSICYLAVQIYTQIWLQRWGNDNAAAANTQTKPKHSTHYWIFTYFAWLLSSVCMLAFTVGNSTAFIARRASKKLHTAMLGPLTRSPMSFFDVTSSGKIVNRFAHDIKAIDIELPILFIAMIFTVMMAVTIFAFCIAATPYFALIMIPLGVAYYWLGRFFLVSSREIKRLDSAARSPMYSHFGETLAGLVTIRAYHDSDRFAVQAMSLLDRSQQASYLTNATTRWLQIMLDQMSLLILCIVSLLAIVQRNSSHAGYFSIVLSQIGNLTIAMSGILTCVCGIETAIVSVERVREYSKLTPEALDVIPDSKTDPAWPQRGEITFTNYSTRYREELGLVLKNVDVKIKAGERIGIVGRTGAGKSSVALALFRMIEATEGSIYIDGIDISILGLHELRSRLTIIPQDPFLFGDSLRANLDPFNEHADTELWDALESASLKSYISSLPEGLNSIIENGGENMSLGQRQLMSLARAMLKNQTHVLFLDEATAAIDVETENAIQQALRREFKNCTVLTIAHRINTIMDSDRILVLDYGRVAEYDDPQTLLENKESIFYDLASKSGNA